MKLGKLGVGDDGFSCAREGWAVRILGGGGSGGLNIYDEGIQLIYI